MKFLTGNEHKFREVKGLAEQFGFHLEWANLSLPEIRGSLREVALAKARDAFERVGPVICEDSGFFVEDLNGFPGEYSKWVFQKLGCEGIVRLAKGSRACFRTVAVYYDGRPLVASGEVWGEVVEPRGSGGFGYDPIFLPDGHSRTFAEDPLYKLENSHRFRAFRTLFKLLKKQESPV